MFFKLSKKLINKQMDYRFCIAIIIFLQFSYFPCLGKAESEVILRNSFLTKTLFYESSGMTSITNIIQGNLDQDTDIEIGILDQLSMHVVNPTSGETKNVIKFKWTSGILRPAVIHSDKNKYYRIMSRGPVSDVGLMNHLGEPIWIYKPAQSDIVNTMAAGDLDRNGLLEFYVATNSGLFQINTSGEKLWQKGRWVYDIDIVAHSKGDRPLAVTICSDGQIQFRNYEGDLVNEVVPPINANNLQVIEWPKPEHILIISGSNIYVIDFAGKIIFSHKLDQHIYAVRGTPVQLDFNQKPYFAVVAKFSSITGKALLCLFSPNGKLVYKELINTTQGLLAMQAETSESEVLIVGDGPGKVYKYAKRGTSVKGKR